MDRSLYAYALKHHKKRAKKFQHPGGVVAFLEILEAVLVKIEAELNSLKETGSTTTFGQAVNFFEIIISCYIFFCFFKFSAGTNRKILSSFFFFFERSIEFIVAYG